MTGFLLRLRDLIDRGRLDVGQLRLADMMSWLLALSREQGDTPLADLCAALESAARLALLKARRLNGAWQAVGDDEETPWLGPPPELPMRRSWLGERFANGALSFVAPARSYETIAPGLASIAPDRLRAAMLAVMSRQHRPPAVQEHRVPRIPTEVCATLILERLQEHGEVRLHGIAGDSRDAHVAAFLSCLILVRQGRVTLMQDELFGDIIVRPAAEVLHATA